jgi:branched-chain amino acid transport system substrate-binding protein
MDMSSTSKGKLGIAAVILLAIIVIAAVGFYVSYKPTAPTTAPPKEPLKVGLVIPLTGAYAAEAKSQLEGVNLAVKEFNEKGGVLGHPIEVYWRDDELKPDVALRRVKEVVEVIGVKVLFGHLHAGIALSSNEYAKEKGLWYWALSGMTEVFQKKDVIGPYTFRYFLGTPEMAITVSEYWLSKPEIKRIYIVAADYAYGWSLRDWWVKKAKERGIEVVGIDNVAVGTTDFSPYITKILAQKPDLVCSLNFGLDFVNFVKQAYQYGVQKTTPIATGSISMAMAKGAGKEAMENVYGAIQYYYEVEQSIPEAKEFNKKFMAAYGYPPEPYAESAYAIASITFQAIEKAGTWPIDLNKIKETLTTSEFTTGKGKVKIDPVTRGVYQPFIVVKGKAPAKITGEWDVFEIVRLIPYADSGKYLPTKDVFGY